MKTTISLTLLTIAAALLPGSFLELQRGGPAWRIVTCHFTHFTYEQLAWDALVFLLLGLACARRDRGTFRATLLASIVIIPIAVLAFAPNVTTYRGLSGIDSALFALLLTMEWKRNWIVTLCAIGFAMKVLFEMKTGATVFVSSSIAFAPVPMAHLAGAAVGWIIATIATSRRRSDWMGAHLRKADVPIGWVFRLDGGWGHTFEMRARNEGVTLKLTKTRFEMGSHLRM